MRRVLTIVSLALALGFVSGPLNATDITQLQGITGKIGNEDIYWGNGNATDTFSVPTYTGGTVTLTKVPSLASNLESILKGVWYASNSSSITDHGNATVAGSLAWVVAAAGSTDKTKIVLPAGSYPLTTAVTIPSNIVLDLTGGPVISGAASKLIMDSPAQILARSDQQVFDCTGKCVTFTNPGTVYADWWGADKGGVNDAYADLNATIESVPRDSTVVLGDGTYLVKTGINIRTTSINIKGVCSGADSGTIIKAGTGLTGTLFNWEPPQNTIGQHTIECMYLDGNNIANVGLRLVNGEHLRYRGINTRWNLVAGVEYDGDVPSYYVSGVTSNLYNVTCQDSTSDWNPINWWIHRDWDDANGKVFTNFHFKNCSGSHASGKADVLLDGGNSTATTPRDIYTQVRGFSVDWDGGSFQSMSGNETTVGVQPAVVWVQDGVTLKIGNVYSEKANTGWLDWYIAHKSGVHVLGGGNMGIYDDSDFVDNATLCASTGSLVSGIYIRGQKEPQCVGDVISDKPTYGSPNFPSTLYGLNYQQQPPAGGYLAFKGNISTDSTGTRWMQVEDDFASDPLATYKAATRSSFNRWSPMDGRIIIPFDYTTLNLGNYVMWFAEAEFVITAMDVVITKTFTSSDTSTYCNGIAGYFQVGSVPKREKFLSDTQLAISNLTTGTVIRAWDNDNATTGVLRWSYTSTSTSAHGDDNKTITTTTTTTGNHLARHMNGYPTSIFAEHPTWSDNSTLDYENSYVMFAPCPYTVCEFCNGVWTDGEGFLVITGYPLEYN